MLAVMSVLTGVVYPLLVTASARLLFPDAAAGSVVYEDGKAVASALIGQSFSDPGSFWSRPSATGRFPYDASASSGSNLGPLHPRLRDEIRARVAALRAADPTQLAPVPIDLVTSSASGLDPHISPAAAAYQVPRVARVRGLPRAAVQRLVDENVEGRTLGILGEPRVNVVRLNRALAGLARAGAESVPGGDP